MQLLTREKRTGGTFGALPRLPQVLHTYELVISVKAVVLGLGVVVV